MARVSKIWKLEDVGLAVGRGVDGDGLLEEACVGRDGLGGPLAGGDELAELGDDAVGVVGGVDAADDGAVSAVEHVAEKVLAPEDQEPLAGAGFGRSRAPGRRLTRMGARWG